MIFSKRTAFALLAGLFFLNITSCGSDEDKSSKKSSSADSKLVDCGDPQKRLLSLEEGSYVEWVAKKNETIPVTGWHKVTGTFASDSKTELTNPTLDVSFNDAALDSGIPLRDERIVEYIFGLAEGYAISFDIEAITASDGSLTFPAVGDTKEYEITGSLGVAGTAASVIVPVFVTATATGLILTNSSKETTVAMGAQLKLDERLAKLMEVAQVKIDETLSFRINLHLADACK